MKQGVVFVLASAVLLAAVASAHVFAPLPDGTAFRASAKAATPSGGPSSPSKPVVEIRGAPVPLQTRDRPPIALPAALETAAVMPSSQADMSVEGGTGDFAKGAIEADGYKAVKNITPGPDGTWRARALRGMTEVVLTVDRDGRVSAD